jgi:actin-related protein
VPALERDADARADPVLSIVSARQWTDWRDLRLLDIEHPKVREAIARFCEKVADALQDHYTTPEERRKKEEAERIARQEAERIAREEATRAEQERKVKTETERIAREEAARAENERKLKAEAERREAEDERRRAEEEKRRQQEQARAEAEGRRRADEERKRLETEEKRRLKEEEARRRAQAIQERGASTIDPATATLLETVWPTTEPKDRTKHRLIALCIGAAAFGLALLILNWLIYGSHVLVTQSIIYVLYALLIAWAFRPERLRGVALYSAMVILAAVVFVVCQLATQRFPFFRVSITLMLVSALLLPVIAAVGNFLFAVSLGVVAAAAVVVLGWGAAPPIVAAPLLAQCVVFGGFMAAKWSWPPQRVAVAAFVSNLSFTLFDIFIWHWNTFDSLFPSLVVAILTALGVAAVVKLAWETRGQNALAREPAAVAPREAATQRRPENENLGDPQTTATAPAVGATPLDLVWPAVKYRPPVRDLLAAVVATIMFAVVLWIFHFMLYRNPYTLPVAYASYSPLVFEGLLAGTLRNQIIRYLAALVIGAVVFLLTEQLQESFFFTVIEFSLPLVSSLLLVFIAGAAGRLGFAVALGIMSAAVYFVLADFALEARFFAGLGMVLQCIAFGLLIAKAENQRLYWIAAAALIVYLPYVIILFFFGIGGTRSLQAMLLASLVGSVGVPAAVNILRQWASKRAQPPSVGII